MKFKVKDVSKWWIIVIIGFLIRFFLNLPLDDWEAGGQKTIEGDTKNWFRI